MSETDLGGAGAGAAFWAARGVRIEPEPEPTASEDGFPPRFEYQFDERGALEDQDEFTHQGEIESQDRTEVFDSAVAAPDLEEIDDDRAGQAAEFTDEVEAGIEVEVVADADPDDPDDPDDKEDQAKIPTQSSRARRFIPAQSSLDEVEPQAGTPIDG